MKRALVPGSALYAKVDDEGKVKNLWLKPKSGEFIGSNLAIYTKV